MVYGKLYTLEEREQIEQMIKRGVHTRAIAERLNRSYDSLRNEICSSGGRAGYKATNASEKKESELLKKSTQEREEKKRADLEERVELLEQQQKLILKILKEKNGINNEL